MENTPNTQPSELTGNALFYKNPQPLNPEQHAGLGVKKIDEPFAFLREAHAIPVTVTEFGMTSSAYPIIFVGEEFTPVAAMGVRSGENLFVRADGQAEQDFYVPAFARRYPFVFANDNPTLFTVTGEELVNTISLPCSDVNFAPDFISSKVSNPGII